MKFSIIPLMTAVFCLFTTMSSLWGSGGGKCCFQRSMIICKHRIHIPNSLVSIKSRALRCLFLLFIFWPFICSLHWECTVIERWSLITSLNKAFPHSIILPIQCCCCSVSKSCQTLRYPMGHSTPSSLVLYYLAEFAQIHCVNGTI